MKCKDCTQKKYVMKCTIILLNPVVEFRPILVDT